MYTKLIHFLFMLSSIAFIAAAAPPKPTTPVLATVNATTTISLPGPTQLAKFQSDYAAYLSAQSANSAFKVFETAKAAGKVPAVAAQAQEQAYLNALQTATGPIAPPPFVTGLPKDQQSFWSSFNAHVATLAQKDYAIIKAINLTIANNGTLSNSTGNGTLTTTKSSTSAKPTGSPTPSPSPSPAPTTTTTSSSKGLGNPSQPTGIYKAAGAAAVGVMGIAALL